MDLDFKTGFVAGASPNTDNSVTGIKQAKDSQEKNSFAAALNSAKDKVSGRTEEKTNTGQPNKKEVVKKFSEREKPQTDYKKDVKSKDDGSPPVNTPEKLEKQKLEESMKAEAPTETQTSEIRSNTEAVGKEAEPPADTTVVPAVENNEAVISDEQISQIVQAIAEIAGVTPQQVESALKKLDLTPQQLIQPENIAKFLVEAKELGDPGELLKVPELPSMIKGIEDAVKAVIPETEAVIKEPAVTGDTPVKLDQPLIPTEPASDEKAVTDKNDGVNPDNTAHEKDTQNKGRPEINIPPELNIVIPSIHRPRNIGYELPQLLAKVAESAQTAQTAQTSQINPEEANVTDETTATEGTGVNGVSQGDITKIAGEAKEQKGGNPSGNNQQFPKEEKAFEQQLGTTSQNSQDTAIKNDSHTPIVIRQGDETIVEVGGKTISRTPQNPVLNREAASVLNQISERIKIDFRPNSTEMKINLKPNELGNVTVKIVTESGHVTAEIVTENSKVKELVEQSLDTLKQTLRERGVDVGELSVSVGQQENDERMKQFVMEQEKSKGRMSQILSKLDGEEASGPDSINYVKESDFDGSTVHYTA